MDTISLLLTISYISIEFWDGLKRWSVKKDSILSSLFSIRQISNKIQKGDILPVDLVKVCLSRIKKLNPILNSFITVIDEQLNYKQSEISEKEIQRGNYFGPLHGIPFSVKDMFYVKGIRFTAGSRIFTNYISQVDATAVKRMKQAGAILIGSNNLNEFASGINGKNPFYGDSKNPWTKKEYLEDLVEDLRLL
jgi:aspartyl-tRNA(Asn)/glutamyl-tRNA(Gln) amidotransferase subunit A